MSKSPIHSVSVAGVTIDHVGRVLLIKRRDNGDWQAPGGVLEAKETFEQGVVREVFEETGVEVEVEKLTGVYKNVSLAVVALVYRCRPVAGRPSESAEAVAVEWVDLESSIARMSPVFSIRVQDAFQDGAPASRAHDGVNLL